VKIALASSSEVSLPLLEFLTKSEEFDLQLVITNPDKATGRGQLSAENQVAAWCRGKNLILAKPFGSAELLNVIDDHQIDLLITVAYGHILKDEVISRPRYGAINLHYSLLPKYRGAAPVQRAILNGEELTGVTVFKLDAGMDSGPIYLQKELKIDSDEKTSDLLNRLNLIGIDLVNQTLKLIIQGAEPVPQSNADISFAPKFAKQDGAINWRRSADDIYNQYRAIGENPGVFTNFSNIKLKISKITRRSFKSLSPGEFSVVDQSLIVGTASFDLLIDKVIPEGRKEMTGKDFFNGLKEKGNHSFA
jgi:methionyl-tRNA formyltransferase